ncbi:glycoside hydrolase family 15 protein [Halococcoides cellulosivorans]|uniref:Glycoside hydrolase family 15 protein n=1 Tax=Halococcoides cellulosivorans TaxID=1679096 RepID=A0A2R4X3F7_9EURY|nr:glycoside hydrolase family 15 protein [Halococcoides cellulosivorans]AWB28326.1 glycoside hydrolase family 15 protein [Halococcoides cellulosivorans]
MTTDGYTPISAYGLIGNLETAALVGADGSIDWCCLPYLQSPSVFGALLDVENGGHFRIQPAEPFESSQRYEARTNVLRTDFETDAGSARLTDFMPILSADPAAPFAQPWVFRKVECTDGRVPLDVDFRPRFDYARGRTTVESLNGEIVARGNGEHLSLSTDAALQTDGVSASGVDRLEAGDVRWHTVQYGQRKRPESVDPETLLARVREYWHNWTHDCRTVATGACPFEGPHHALVERSELVLKLLMHHRTGAIAAAPTTSLPELIGGTRNWDYRFSWIRDAAFTIQALNKLGHTRESRDYFDWCLDVIHTESETFQPFQPMFGLHGDTEITEETLDHLSGYRGSAPVRIGNAARNQLQLDVFGELVHALYETCQYGETITETSWETISDVVEYVCTLWDKRDAGMWEVRSDPEQFVHSKVMCWVALDRGIEIARAHDFDAPIGHWASVRSDVREAVIEQGFSDATNSFGRSFESPELLDAAALRIPLVGFLPIDDDRVQGTIDAIRDRLTTEEGLVYRYEGRDGIAGGEGAFLLCSFWLVDCLAMSGDLREAEALFETIVEYASPLGLFSEEVIPQTGELLGNYPQAFSHLGLINSVLYLQAGEEGVPKPDLDGVSSHPPSAT